MAPSVSYSITVRLEVASRGRAVSEITRAVEHTGGVVTALDVTSGGNERLRVDVTCAARDTAHAEAIVAALAAIDGVTVHKVSDRTFLLHLGGKIEASEYAAVVATGRSDYPNQINNVLAFPGVFRGLLDAQSRHINDDMLIAAAQALADVVSPDEIGPHYIIPSVFHPDVTSSVAAAVRDAATAELDR
jgi:Malic enzyme, NAD binding domain